MRIALINNLYPPYIIGGNEMLAHDVVEELRRRRHEVHVITGRGHEFKKCKWFHPILDLDLDRRHENFLGEKKPTYYDLIKQHLFNFRSYRVVMQTLKMLDPDLVIAWNLYMASMAPLAAATQLKLPTVIQVCGKWLIYSLKDIGLLLCPGTFHGRLTAILLQAIIQPWLQHLTNPRHIIAISHFIRDRYIEAGFPASMIGVIHLGVPTNLFDCKPRTNSTDAKTRLIYVGSLWEGKGLQVALRALGLLARNIGRERVHLDIYGDGTDSFKDYLKSIVREEGIEKCVTFHGFVEQQKISTAYQSHDILVFPSIWDEPFAAVPVEAMSSGMAIVATSAGGTPEAITNGQTGLIVPPNDPHRLANALERLITDGDLRVRLGQNAAVRAREEFDFTTYVDRLEAYYTNVGERRSLGSDK